MDTVFTSSDKDIHADGAAVAAEYTYVSVLKRYDCAVENTVGAFLLVAADDRILIIAPYRHVLSCWFFLPRHVRQIVSDDFTHCFFLLRKIFTFLFCPGIRTFRSCDLLLLSSSISVQKSSAFVHFYVNFCFLCYFLSFIILFCLFILFILYFPYTLRPRRTSAYQNTISAI